MRRGYTLIELMICVALIGIAAVLVGNQSLRLRRDGLDRLQQERALQVLECQADAMLRGGPADPSLHAALLSELPEARFEARPEGPDATVLAVEWRSPLGPRSRSLTVLGRLP